MENPSETNTTDRTYKLWRERNKEEREYIDANRLANIRRDIIKNKRLTDAEICIIKDEVKAIIRKIKDKMRKDDEIQGENSESCLRKVIKPIRKRD